MNITVDESVRSANPSKTRVQERKSSNQKQELVEIRTLDILQSKAMIGPNIHSKLGYVMYSCGCGYQSESSNNFKDHVLEKHKGRCLEGSSHFVSALRKIIVPSQRGNFTCKNQPQIASGKQNLILVSNTAQPKQIKGYYCASCSVYFDQAVQFSKHCLIKCEQLQNPLSSHCIQKENDWQTKKQKNQDPSIQQISGFKEQKGEDVNAEKGQELINSMKICNFTNVHPLTEHKISSNQFFLQLDKFTREVIQRKLFKKFFQTARVRTYFHDYECTNIVVILNVKFQDESAYLYEDIKCQACCNSYTNLYLFKKHVLETYCTQSFKSKFFVLNKSLFLNRYAQSLQRSNLRYFQSNYFKDKFDPELCYRGLQSNRALSQSFRQYLLKNQGYIKLFADIWSYLRKPYHCKTCGLQMISVFLPNHWTKKSCKLQRQAIINLNLDGNSANKHLDLDNNFLQDLTFNCPCDDQPRIKQQFVEHLLQKHEGFMRVNLSFKPLQLS